MGLFATLDVMFAPLVAYPTLFVMLISLIITIFVTLLNLVLIKKEVRDRIKNQMKYYQAEIKIAQKEKNIKKMQELQKGQLDIQLLHMKESFKISAVSILLLWLIFAWMQHLYIPSVALDENGTGILAFNGQNHSVFVDNVNGTRILSAEGKSYDLELGGLIAKSYKAEDVDLFGRIWKVALSNEKVTFNLIMAHVPIFGNLGLIGWYILTALAFGIISRKLFDLA